ncbi:TonB-dependent receptor domain-containing protein [Aureispira anguillae]|uniref:TonB-dependent receptor n=1 Tax=Aureispira anguillae TaxID=2864201 RepID=A0A916DVN8_9BACT|nr:TonB-dependent receptor [Aureispira anguillae]BDS15339.1 TonB-dependent receptor [Aureispira anguillae]
MRLLGAYIFLFFCYANIGYSQYTIGGKLTNSEQKPLADVFIILAPTNATTTTNAKGQYIFKDIKKGTYVLTIDAVGFQQKSITVELANEDVVVDVGLDSLSVVFEKNVIVDGGEYHLNPAISGVTLLSAKTINVIDLKKCLANQANNNARELFKTVPGLNVWENDNSGIQLNIGGRGLNPNRTSNFNTRQNGYDISADALGYPETYYTPPAQSLQRIEVLRGAASLQFGTQFGGMLNFVMKQGAEDKKFEFVTENTYGGFNFFNTFNSIGGTVANKKFNYYAFYQYKRGDGWRPNANFEVHNGYAQIEYRPTSKWTIRAEQTVMQYLAHQPGGLTDAEFSQNARQSKRERNWFRVNWNLSALTIDYKFSPLTQLNIRNFALFADRQSLGNLEAINRPDYGEARDLIKGRYMNFGNETRLVHRYKFLKSTSAFVAGVRIYKGYTEQKQGYSNRDTTGSLADFTFVEAAKGILKSNYRFPSFNFAAFAENYFSITDKFSVTPGIRFEYIQTEAEGYYQDLIVVPSSVGWDTIRNEAIDEYRTNSRAIVLAGIGLSYKLQKNLEIYGNFSQNYRGINFNDMRISNPNQEVDPNLKDEYGFNADLGFRGSYKGLFNFNATLFYLNYRRRIGNIQLERPNKDNPLIIEPYTLRTNVGDARVLGAEIFVEADFWKLFSKTKNTPFSLTVFTNFSVLDGRYTQTANSSAAGKQLEFVAPIILRTGLSFAYKTLKLSYQYSFTSQHYSDATNAELVPTAVVGIIPSYGVMDISASYQWKWFTLQTGINNLTDEVYFTRRATSYPGPGILPADGLSFYITLRFNIGVN